MEQNMNTYVVLHHREITLALTDRRIQTEHESGGLGLSCTPEGVFLAGVPLLCGTVEGLAPRPMDELAVLMKSAYGHDVDPARSYPGLDVIAKALNRGDLGRAMVAAIHLRLPRLNPASAAHIAFADDALSKFDPHEPRDERGRWTSGGGSPANSAAKPASRKHPAKPIKPMRPIRPASPIEPARRHPDFGDTDARRILISNPTGPIGGMARLESLAVNLGISRECVNHANAPRYFEKTQACALVQQQCGWLIEANGDNSRRLDGCIWPDGAAAIMKFGVLVPFRRGHPF
jgi:hypothetical protein